MDTQDLRTLRLLEEIENNQLPSQRYLASRLNVSLGLTNAFIKRLTKKGYFKIKTIRKNRIKYILTPKGAAEKTRLTYKYIQYSFRFYKRARVKFQKLYRKLNKQDVHRIVFYGSNEVAEIAYVFLQTTDIELVAVVDEKKAGERFFNFITIDPNKLPALPFDNVLITELKNKEHILVQLIKSGVPRNKISLLE